jgi:hypothetical protein
MEKLLCFQGTVVIIIIIIIIIGRKVLFEPQSLLEDSVRFHNNSSFYVFHVILRMSDYYFHKQYYLVGLCSCDELWLVRLKLKL